MDALQMRREAGSDNGRLDFAAASLYAVAQALLITDEASAIGAMTGEPALIQRDGHAPRPPLKTEVEFVYAARDLALELLNEVPPSLRVTVAYACERMGARLWVSCRWDSHEVAMLIEFVSGHLLLIAKRCAEPLH